MVATPRVHVDSARQAHRFRAGRIAFMLMVPWLLLATSVSLAMEPSSGLSWALVNRNCVPPPAAEVIGCGDLGNYLFAQDVSQLTCQVVDTGPPADEVYTAARPVALADGQTWDLEHHFPLGEHLRPGGPMTKTAGLDADAIAIDWNNAHGQAVMAIIGQIAGPSVRTILLALDDEELVNSLGSAIGDAHVLANLCKVIEDVDIGGGAAPRVINMSFGRWTEDTFPNGCTDTLSCQVNRAVLHLVERGVTVTAAAGNHRELLFPAVLRDTLSVGAFDLKRYGVTLQASESWETPLGVDVLMPGDGLCTTAALAAGTSFSSASLAGLLAADNRPRSTLTHAAITGVWRPTWIPGINCFLLTTDSNYLPGCMPTLDQFVIEAVTGTSCERPDSNHGNPSPIQSDLKIVTSMVPTVPVVPARLPSFAQWQAENHSPTPGDEICTPCGGGGGGGALARTPGVVPTKGIGIPLHGDDLVLDFSGSPKLRPSLSIDEIFFRVGTSFYQVKLDDSDLLALERGEVDMLRLSKAALLPHEDEQPSLYFHMWEDQDGDLQVGSDELFWTSAPILIPIVIP